MDDTSDTTKLVIDSETLKQGHKLLQIKAAIVLGCLVTAYVCSLLMDSWWLRIPSLILLAVSAYCVATVIAHDAAHDALSSSPTVNRVMAFGFDLLGASSFIWKFKHNELHHDAPNVAGLDNDIEQLPFFRMSPRQQRRPWHRLQHLYAVPLYGMLPYHFFVSDLFNLTTGSVGGHAMPRPRTFDLTTLFAGKVVFAMWTLIVPIWMLGWWALPISFALTWAVGLALSTTVQLGHALPGMAHPVDVDPNAFNHALATTSDIATSSRFDRRVVGFLTGGLDLQVIHHIAPHIPHTLYSRLVDQVSQIADENSVEYQTQRSFSAAVASHYRWLKTLGATSPS